MKPMLATLAEAVPTGPDWAHEVKWDGMRVLAQAAGGRLRLTSRSGREVTGAYPELAPLADLYDDLVLDGEVIALEAGVPSFAALTERIHVVDARRAARLAASRPVTLMAFDLLRLLGQDLRDQPWSARRALLEQLDIDGPRWQVPPVHDDGAALLSATRASGLEGIVSKRRASPYASGRRSADWLKTPHRPTVSVAVGGWRPETGSPGRLGAVLVGVPGEDGRWEYAGRVGSGLAGAAGAALLPLLREASCSPFATPVPREDAAGARWCELTVVLDVRSLGRGASGKLRQPSSVRVRRDLTPTDLQEGRDG